MSKAFSNAGFEWCVVGDPGNAPTREGRGAVSHVFEMAKYPVTNTQYCLFLNALTGAKQDACYTPLMSEHFFGGVERDPGTGGCRPRAGSGNRPVVFVSWFNAQQFARWLSDHDDAWEYRLPTRDEWLKAAAFRGPKGWARYLTGEDEAPSQNPGEKNSANFYDARAGWALPSPHIADVNLYSHESHYGTVGQAGNCAEWVDADMPNGWKVALGGSLFRSQASLLTTSSEGDAPEKKLSTFGFRVIRVEKGSGGGSREPGRESARSEARRGDGGGSGAYVRVGDAFNPPDALFGGYGRVNYVFEMGRCALSNREYSDFLNAVAKAADPFELFHKDMEAGVLGGIARVPCGDGWSYRAKDGWADKPVVYINFFSAARYANWLHYGCPRTGRSEVGTTEGTAAQGAYDTRSFGRVSAGEVKGWKHVGRRNRGARYWIPDNDEWYKAAYFDPEKVSLHKYWEYPTRSSTLPGNRESQGANAANYQRGETLGVGAPCYFADVQAFGSARSYYGTVQQGGNAWEWLEDFRCTAAGVECGLRGGSFGYTETGLHAGNEDFAEIGIRSYVFGVRLAKAAAAEGWAPVETPFSAALTETLRLVKRAMQALFSRVKRGIGR